MNGWVRTGRLLAGISREIGTGLVLAYVGVSAASLVAPLLLAAGLRPLVDGATSGRSREAVVGVVVVAAALLLSVTAPPTYRWATIRLRERAIMVMQRRFLDLATAAPRLTHFERPEFWDRLQLLKRGIETLSLGAALALIGPLVVGELVVAAVLLAQLSPVLVFVPFVALPAAWLNRWAEGLRRTAELRTAEDRRTAAHLFSVASEAAPAKEVRVYGLRTALLDRHRTATERVHATSERAAFQAVAVSAGGWLLFAAAYAGASVLVLREAAAGRATAGDVAMTLGLATAVVLAANRFSDLAGSVQGVQTAAGHYHWLEDEAPSADRTDLEPPPNRLTRGIELEGVTFGYAGSHRPALRGVSLVLPAGAVVAVVGENGAGKTTLVKLLCGMYAPSGGRIRADDVDLGAMDLEVYRERIAAGFQDFMRFELLAREAVGVGDLPRLDDDAAVRHALARAGAGAGFTERLPAGLDTQLGPSWAGGVDLSGGEWQKLALARSLLRPRPLLVILDEPTASLDPQTEHTLFTQVAEDARRGQADGRVTVLISHRFSTVRMADLIVVLDQGRVVERGTHDELVVRQGLYAELYHLQARAYR